MKPANPSFSPAIATLLGGEPEIPAAVKDASATGGVKFESTA